MAKKAARTRASSRADILAYQHDERRVNNPEVGMVDPDLDPGEDANRWRYDAHIDPALQFDMSRGAIESLIDEALASGDQEVMRRALEDLKRMSAPYLNWAGKAERTAFDVDTVSLHVHERIDPATILTAVRRRMKATDTSSLKQGGLFRAWFEQPLPYREAIEFYKHDRGWANRLVAGDSLLVMNSLVQKEGMAGQVQMIYIDPPYGIRYGSNFQPFVNKRDVKDRKDEDLTQEPEMIKAFRDTWELGIHSYLTYLRDRLLLARELLHESGSVFVQIGDENAHHVRELLDEVFGPSNAVASIVFRKKTMPMGTKFLEGMDDSILWYARSKAVTKYRQLFIQKDVAGDQDWRWAVGESGLVRQLTSNEHHDHTGIGARTRIFRLKSLEPSGPMSEGMFEYHYRGRSFAHPRNGYGTGKTGLDRLISSGRVQAKGTLLNYRLFLDDYDVSALTTNWRDTVGADDKRYVVQTNTSVVTRCLLMTTDPGDLVFDPTCGSGTTAYVAEKWGRRWITCDTSRVAITLAKQRLMTASYDYYTLKHPDEGLKGGFVYKTVPHVTLKSIANNPEIDELYERLHPAIESTLSSLNDALRASPPPPFDVTEGGRRSKTVDFTLPASKTVTLPSGEAAPAGALLEWEVPFDFPDVWPDAAREPFDRFHKARQAMQQAMDASIAAHADQEVLYDQPAVDRNTLRITGPFTVEAVPFPTVLSLDEADAPRDADASIGRSGASSRQHQWRDELLKTGIRGRAGQMLTFADLEALPELQHLHCTGHLDTGERVVVSFGPEHAALEQRQVELAIREAGDLFPRPKMIVFAAFTFDPEAAKDIDATRGIVALKAQMNTDLLTEDLKKARASNQSFWLMGQPEVDVRRRHDGTFEVEVLGFDYFDTVKGDLVSGGKGKIAAWALDTDYDERSLFPRQVFFPMAGAKDGWNQLRRDIRAELNEALLGKLHGTVSLPFEAGENRKVAVKIVDDRGIESLKVIPLES